MIKSGNKNEFFIRDIDEQDLRDGSDFAQLKADCVSFIEAKGAATYAHLNRQFANGYHLNLALEDLERDCKIVRDESNVLRTVFRVGSRQHVPKVKSKFGTFNRSYKSNLPYAE